MRQGGDRRGNAADRRRRKHKLLEKFGNGHTAPCTWCSTPLTFETIEADRVKPYKGYKFENLVPACRKCNASRGDKPVDMYVTEAIRPAFYGYLIFTGAMS